jgi:hypothetical protein
MKAITTRLFIVFCLILCITGCKKEKSERLSGISLSGKLKKLTAQINTNPNIYTYYFYYDSTDGKLVSVRINNREYIRLYKQVNNYIRIDYDENALLSVQDSLHNFADKRLYKIYLDNNGYINRLSFMDTVTLAETTIVDSYNQNGVADSIIGTGDNSFLGPLSSFREWEYVYSGGSLQHYRWFVPGVSFLFPPVQDTVFLTYTGNENNAQAAPLQHMDILAGTSSAVIGMNITYILGLNNIYAYKPERYLIDSIAFHPEDPFATPWSIVCQYQFNGQRQVSKLSITNSYTFDLEYY